MSIYTPQCNKNIEIDKQQNVFFLAKHFQLFKGKYLTSMQAAIFFSFAKKESLCYLNVSLFYKNIKITISNR